MTFNRDLNKQPQEVIFSRKIKKTSHHPVNFNNNSVKNNLPSAPLVTIYKFFIRPHIDDGDILYDQTFNNSFHEKLKSIQYNAALAITGAIRGSSIEKLYQELGFESLQQRQWYRKLCFFFKIKNQSPNYLSELTPTARQAYMTRNKNSIPLFNVKHDYFKNSFFPSTIIERNSLDSNIKNSESGDFQETYISFHKTLRKFYLLLSQP